jgi:hypothetical protein
MSSSDRALEQFRPEAPADYREILLGRTLAFCLHPLLAWQFLSPSWRALILTIYAATGFFAVLSALFLTA